MFIESKERVVILVMEYLEDYFPLSDFLKKMGEEELKKCAYQILSGL